MILDTSAVLAILQSEEGWEELLETLESADRRRMSAPSLVEAGIVLQARYGDHGERELDLFVQRGGVEVVPFTEDHARVAREAYRRFGKGRHAAALNYGDCFSYALSVSLNEPLLFTGDDFPQTDVGMAADPTSGGKGADDTSAAAAREPEDGTGSG